MSAVAERAALLRLAETIEDELEALAACLIGHARLPDPDSSAGWLCGCLHAPRLGESHALHQAGAVLALQRRRAAR
jgi:hypothetical protein